MESSNPASAGQELEVPFGGLIRIASKGVCADACAIVYVRRKRKLGRAQKPLALVVVAFFGVVVKSDVCLTKESHSISQLMNPTMRISIGDHGFNLGHFHVAYHFLHHSRT
jgi:hypothetical protein